MNWDSTRTLLRSVRLAAAYILLAAIILGANPFKGETVGPFDLLASFPGWNDGGHQVKVRNGERSDVLDAILPEWMEARRQLREGIIPLWNPLPAGGHAAILDLSRTELTPAFAIFAAVDEPTLGFYLGVLFNLSVAGLGMHLLIRRHTSALPATFAGISYMMCGFITAWLFWPHTFSAMWVPWLLLMVDGLMMGWKPSRFIMVGVFTAMMFLGAFPFVGVIGLGCAFVLILVYCILTRDSSVWWRGVCAVMAMLLGLGLIAIPLFSLVVMLQSSDLSYRNGGSVLRLMEHGKLLLRPWSMGMLRVEYSMYVGMLALALAPVGMMAIARKEGNRLLISSILWLLVGVVIAFAILPQSIGRQLPVLSNNPWSRCILLVNIGLIVLASFGLSKVMSFRIWGRGAVVIGLSVVVLQAYDLGDRFRKYNGRTDPALFYDGSEVLRRVPVGPGSFQYAAVDGGLFLISGTTGAVGLGDWFAHSMRSTELHNVLDAMAESPFQSPTSTRVSSDAYHWDTPISDILANCYLIHPRDFISARSVLSSKGKSKTPIPPLASDYVVQPFRLSSSEKVARILVRTATYREVGLDGEILFSLSLMDPKGGSRILQTGSVPARIVEDNRWLSWELEDSAVLEPGEYEVSIKYNPGPAAKRLTIWRFPDAGGTLRIGDKELSGSLEFAILGDYDGSLEPFLDGRGFLVSKNRGCMEGPYWTPDISDPLRGANTSAIEMLSYIPHEFTLLVTHHSPGFVVVPMQYQRGWHVYVDNKLVRPRLVAGIAPAIKLAAGRHIIEMKYKPPGFGYGLIVSILALLALLLIPLIPWVSRKASTSLGGRCREKSI